MDAVRALALFGVLVMNLRTMSGLTFLSSEALASVQSPFDRFLDTVLCITLDNKSLSAFSFLFGLSFSLLLSRKSNRPGFVSMYARRLFVLALFGLLNVAFLFWADILLIYALLGALLWPAAKLRPKKLLVLATIVLAIGPSLLMLYGIDGKAGIDAGEDPQAMQGMASTSYWAAMSFHLSRYAGSAGGWSLSGWSYYSNIFGLFLLGLWTGRARIPERLGELRRPLAAFAALAVGLGLPMSALNVTLSESARLAGFMAAGIPLLALGYIATSALLLDLPRFQGASRFLGATGRLALTNYLSYGLVGQVIFYGWAFALGGSLSSSNVLVLAVIVYAIFAVLSYLWLKPFRIGPCEWLWRCLTYLRIERLWREPPRVDAPVDSVETPFPRLQESDGKDSIANACGTRRRATG